MHALGIVLVWTALQVTVICLVVLFVLRLSRKTEPLWRGRVVLAGIVASLILSVFALSPWPSWQGYWSMERDSSFASENSSSDEFADAGSTDFLESSGEASSSANPLSAKATDDELLSPWSAAWAAFLDEMKTPSLMPGTDAEQSHQAEDSLTLASWIALIVLCGVGFGFARLVAGIWLLRKEVAKSPVLDDERVRSAIESIEQSAVKGRPIEVRVTDRLQSAATTGIFGPCFCFRCPGRNGPMRNCTPSWLTNSITFTATIA